MLLQPPCPVKTILAPVDFSAVTERVCETAVALAGALHGRVVILHCDAASASATANHPDTGDTDLARLAVAADLVLAHLRARAAAGCLPVETVHLFGPTVPLILDQAERFAADYIVIGAHGHSASYDVLVGTTTHRVLLHANRPVVVVHGENDLGEGRWRSASLRRQPGLGRGLRRRELAGGNENGQL
jgi:nucleotide-binding universal stress UspA family protein